MRLTQILFRQHLGWHFKKHWRVQGQKVPRQTGAFKALAEKNIPVYDPKDLLNEKRTYEKVEIIGFMPEPIKFDHTHPNWHDKVCLSYRDENVLLEGLSQAKSITKTVEIEQGLPGNIIIKNSSKELDNRVKKIICNAHMFDAEQKVLPKVKDPLRPAWNFPRTYGITQNRVNMLMISKLLQLIENLSGPQLSTQRIVLNDIVFSFPFEKSENLIQFVLTADTLLTSSKPLGPITEAIRTKDIELPNLYPIKDTITLNHENIYEIENIYPINKNITKSHPHTIFIHYNPEVVKNLYEEEVTEQQIFGRSLMKTFTAAAAYAKQQFGNDVKILPKPVTLQCVQTDGRIFHFGVLQLNTLDLDNTEGLKNIWYQTEHIPLFKSCSYVLGRPTLEGYSSEVIKHLIGLYDNF